MTDLLSQWNTDFSFDNGASLPSFAYLHCSSTGDDIYSYTPVTYTPPAEIVHMVTSNSVLVMALVNSHLIRLNLKEESELEEIEISKKPFDIHKIFLDPTGTHVLIAMKSTHPYLILHELIAKLCSKLKGSIIESVGWDREAPGDAQSITILLGTRNGVIQEAIIETSSAIFVGKDKFNFYFKILFNLGVQVPITGLLFERFPGEPNKFFIVATTATRMYQFIGSPNFEGVFSHYDPLSTSYKELPGSPPRSELHFFSNQGGLAQHIAWVAGSGIFHGSLVFGSQSSGDSVVSDTNILYYPDKIQASAVILTQFHFLLIQKSKVVAVSSLTHDVTWATDFKVPLISFAHDASEGVIFAYSNSQVWEVHVKDEEKTVTDKALQMDPPNFQLAEQYARSPQQLDQVWTQQAEYYYDKDQMDLAARYFAKTKKTFEEVALKFLMSDHTDALRKFLKEKLQTIRPHHTTQLTVLCTWLTELYLNKLTELEYKGAKEKGRFEVIRDEFYEFLEARAVPINDTTDLGLDIETISHLMASQGRIDELLFFSELTRDYKKLIAYYLQNWKWSEALQVLSTQKDERLFYKHCPLLMSKCPEETVAILLQRPDLTPRQLIPALMRYDADHKKGSEHQSIRFLQYVVTKRGNTDPAIHNYLLSLYAEGEDEYPLLNFIRQKKVYFDLQYALRLCSQHQKPRACVLIYSKMKLYEEAVELALQVELDLAKSVAEMPQEDYNPREGLGPTLFETQMLRKKLWLRIARHVVENGHQIHKAMEFLKETDLLKIEDILPFFPDFVLMDNFREAVTTSLRQYNMDIDELQEEMKRATNSAELLRVDISHVMRSYIELDHCGYCKFPVLTSPCYFFECSHAFHSHCLEEEILKILSPERKNELVSLEKKLDEISDILSKHGPDFRDADYHTKLIEEKEFIAEQVDDILAAECPFCGDAMVNSIDKPFGADENASSWIL